MPYVTVSIVPPGAGERDGSTSAFGHMWYTLTDDSGNKSSYGFAPAQQGSPFGPGNVENTDNATYNTVDYSKTVYITDSQYQKLQQFGQDPQSFGFDPSIYNGAQNNCVTFTWDALGSIGIERPYSPEDAVPSPDGMLTVPYLDAGIMDLALDAFAFNNPDPNPNDPNVGDGDGQGPGGDTGSMGGAKRSGSWWLHRGNLQIDPLVMDLTGGGIKLTSLQNSSAFFDFYDSGFAQHTSWIAQGTGILVLAPQRDQPFGVEQLIASFAQLRQLAGGADSISSDSPVYSQLRVWIDSNGDGSVDSAELLPLADAGIASINLHSTASGILGPIDETSSFTLIDGTVREIAAVSFEQDPSNTRADDPVSIPSEIAVLPQVAGGGTLHDLQAAMVLQPKLKDLVAQSIGGWFNASYDTIATNVRAIMFEWAGVSGLDPSSRGHNVDARELEFVEQYLGKSYDGQTAGFNNSPIYHAGPDLAKAWNNLYDSVFAQLVLQTPDVAFRVPEFSLENGFVTSLNSFEALNDIKARVGDPSAANISDWELALRVADAYRLQQGLTDDEFATIVKSLTDNTIASLANAVASAMTLQSDGDGRIVETGTVLNDVFYAGQGISEAVGRGGGATFDDFSNEHDTFIYNAGDGAFTIDEFDPLGGNAKNNTLQFGPDIDQSKLRIGTTSDQQSLIIQDGVDGDQITITNALIDGSYGVQRLEFADGTSVSFADFLQSAIKIAGSDGAASTLTGSYNSDVLDGRGATTHLVDYGGGDTFVYRKGYGHLDIDEQDLSFDADNILQLGDGLSPGDITGSYDTTSGNLILTDGLEGDQISIGGMFTYATVARDGIEKVQFSDGTIVDASVFVQQAIDGLETEQADDLSGSPDANVFDGKGGNDTVSGNGGSDTIVFNAEYGALLVDEVYRRGESPVLALGPGVNASDVTVSADTDGVSLIVRDGVQGDQIVLKNQLAGSDSGDDGYYDGITSIRLSDGSLLSVSDLVDRENVGTSGNDTLAGNLRHADLFDGMGGSDIAYGNGGNDTFIFNQGYGRLEIVEGDASVLSDNVLQFGQGISISSISVSVSLDGADLIIKDGVQGDEVVIAKMMLGAVYGVQEVRFSDGTSVSASDLISLITTGSAGNDVLYGTPSAETLDGSGGDDVLIGQGGNDTFVFNAGYGRLEVKEDQLYDDDVNVLRFGEGISQSSIRVKATDDGGSIVISDGVAGDEIVLDDMLSGYGKGVELLSFADGSSLSAAQLLALETTGTSGDDALYGPAQYNWQYGDGPTVFDGKGGNDSITATGNSVFIYERGYGALEINNGYYGDSLLRFGPNIEQSDLLVRATEDGTGLVITDGQVGDSITINEMNLGNVGGIQSVQFDNGNTLSVQELIEMQLASTSSAGETLIGASGPAELLDGKGGDDLALDETAGSDTFIFKRGYGHLEIDADNAGPLNTLQLGSGITRSDLLVNVTAEHEGITIQDGTDGDMVVIDGILSDASTSSDLHGVRIVELADGTTLSSEQLIQSYLDRAATAGDDVLSGSDGADVFDGRGGSDVEVGHGGNDTFIFRMGYGRLQIDEFDLSGRYLAEPPSNTLLLGAGITLNSLRVTVGDDGTSAIVTDGVSGDSISITDAFADINDYSESAVQRVVFSDGSVVGIQQLLALASNGTGGDDTLRGGNYRHSKVIDGHGGKDVAVSADGAADTFVFNQGYGSLEIQASRGLGDVVRLGPGIAASSLSVSDDPTGTGIVIHDGVSGDEIIIDDFLKEPSDSVDRRSGVSEVDLADGTIITAQQLAKMATMGSSGNDTLFGTSGPDVIDGSGGADLVHGDGGEDTFVFNEGYGNLEIDGSTSWAPPTSVLQLGEGIGQNSLRVSATADGTGLQLTDGIDGDKVVIDGALTVHSGYTYFGIGELDFADGQILSASELVSRYLEQTATEGSDTLYGVADPEVFDGKGGGDLEVGRSGADTFVYDAGYGRLEVNETAWGDRNSQLRLGSGIVRADLRVSATADGTGLILHDAIAGDEIILDGELTTSLYSGTPDGIGAVVFADGSFATVEDLVSEYLEDAPTAGSDRLYGSLGADVINGHGGTDYAQGNGGNDTFRFEKGYGSLEINEVDESFTPDNVLQLGEGITADSLQVRATTDGSGGLYLTDGVAGDSITIDGALTQNSDYIGIQQFQFADGSVLTAHDLAQRYLSSNATTGEDILYGTSEGDLFDGKGGDDLALGNGGTDTFVFDRGYGNLEIAASGSGNVLKLGAGITGSDLSVQIADDGIDLELLDGTTGDRVTVDDVFLGADEGQPAVGSVELADHSIITVKALVSMYLSDAETSGQDSLLGSSDSNVFDGKGGGDIERGNGGDDTFVYNRGYGSLSIDEVNFGFTHSQLRLGPGIGASDLRITQSADGNDIIIEDGTSGDQITIVGMAASPLPSDDWSPLSGVDFIQFADGRSLSRKEVLLAAAATLAPTTSGPAEPTEPTGQVEVGTEISDTLVGGRGADSFEGSGGNDTYVGKGGSDTFMYQAGDGSLTIVELASDDNDRSVLTLASGIDVSDLNVSSSVDGKSLVLKDGIAGDQIVLTDMLDASGGGVSEVHFADGTVFSASALIDMQRVATAAGNRLVGSTAAEVFDGKGGSDVEVGNGGDDTFVFNAGYGHLTVIEQDRRLDAASVLLLGQGITAGSVRVAAGEDGSSIVLTDATSGDSVTLDSILKSNYNGVQSVVFADGTTWSRQLLIDKSNEVDGTAQSDVLYGDSKANILDGKGGTDIEYGAGGSDTFVFNAGYGSLKIFETENVGSDRSVLRLGPGISLEALNVSVSENGYDVRISDGVAGDQITIDAMNDSYDGWGVKLVQLADGTKLTRAQILDMATHPSEAVSSTSSNDLLANSPEESGANVYKLSPGDGAVTISADPMNSNTTPGTLMVNGESPQNIWLRQVGSDLEVDIMGTTTSATIGGWFDTTSSQHATISTVSGALGSETLDNQLSQLVQAMAVYSSSHTGFDPTSSANPQITDPTMLATVTSAWHTTM